MPPMVEDAFSDPIAVIKREYEELQRKARQEMTENRRVCMGRDRVMKVSPYQRATAWEEIRALNPTFAVGRGQHEARKLAIAALKAFRRAYRAALELWRAGDRTAVFPQGTWWMATFHQAPVAESG
jgi:putative transposase